MGELIECSLKDLRAFNDVLIQRARELGDRTAYTFLADGEREAGTLSYAELDRRARALAAELQSRGLGGSNALLVFPSGLDFVVAFLGCLYAGTVAVPVYPPGGGDTLPRLLGILRDARPAAVLTTSGLLARARKGIEQAAGTLDLAWIATDEIDPGAADGWRDPGLGREDLAFLQYTSGSTSQPKGVMVRHGNLLCNEELIRQAFRQTASSVVVGWLPLFHDMGLIGNVLQPLYVGGTCVLMSPMAFLQRPLRWLKAIERYKGTTSGGPNFAYDLCVRKIPAQEREALDLSTWEVAFNGAEPVRAETLERFAAAFAPSGFRREAFFPCYGLAEGTLLVSGAKAGSSHAAQPFLASGLERNEAVPCEGDEAGARVLTGSGRMPEGSRVVIADPETLAPCEPGRIGEIWVAGLSVAGGYWQRAEETERVFQAFLAGGEGPFLRTGDLGFVGGDGELFITGRLKDLIILRGRNHYPQDLELTAERSHPALPPGAVAAFAVEVESEERLVVVQEVEDRRHGEISAAAAVEMIEAVRRAVSEHHQVQVHETVLIRRGTIPKTTSGKIRRQACRDLYLNGGLEVVAREVAQDAAAADTEWGAGGLSPEAVLEAGPESRPQLLEGYLTEHAARILRVAPARLDRAKPLSASGLDSLKAVELKHEIEEGLRVEVSLARLLEGITLAQLAETLAPQLSQGALVREDALPPSSDQEGAWPLSPAQKAFWFLHQLAPESAGYNIALPARVTTPLDAADLRRAFQALVDRHACLRTVYAAHRGQPVQRILEEQELAFHEVDARGWSEEEFEAALLGEAGQPFDLEKGPVLRVALFSRSAEEQVLLLVVHHIAIDGWSFWTLLDELRLLYASFRSGSEAALPPLPWRYVDYVRWQAGLLAGPEGERLWEHWQARLAGELPVFDLPIDHPRPPVQSNRGGSLDFPLSERLTGALRALAEQRGTTLYTVLLAAFQVLLHRYTGQRDLLLSSPVTGRSRAELERIVGCFFNAVPMRAGIAGEDPFTGFLEQVRRAVLDALEHQDYPSHLLAERLHPERDPSRLPLFQQVMFIYQKPQRVAAAAAAGAGGRFGVQVDFGPSSLEFFPLEKRFARSDLEMEVVDAGAVCLAGLRYNADLFEPATVQRMAGHLEVLLEAVAADPGQRVGTLPLLSPAERRQLLQDWNDSKGESPRVPVHELIEATAARVPEALAVKGEGGTLTYRELDERANQLAHHLVRSGVVPGALVGVCLERSPDLIVAVLATLKAGAAYVPLDPGYPRERLAFMATEAGLAALVTRGSASGAFAAGAAPVIDLDAGPADGLPSSRPAVAAPVEGLQYVIFTSGSTGRPKGAGVLRHAFTNLVNWYVRELGTGAEDRFLLSTSFSFDLTQKNLFAPLTVGGSLHLAPSGPYDPAVLKDLVSREGITVMNCTPSAFYPLVDEPGDLSRLASLRRVVLGGEPVSVPRLRKWLEAGSCQAEVVNSYGPTECTDVVGFHRLGADELQGDAVVPLGRPVANAELFVASPDLELLPQGVTGELCVGGLCVGMGYLGNPALTAEKFVPHPWAGSPGARLYRTGDRARRRPDGVLEFLGRADHQVKIRGFRIELGEIESVLAAHPRVNQGVVVAWPDARGTASLAAYVEGVDGAPPADADLRSFLQERLPDYMVPGVFVPVGEWPLTPSGKIDRRKLPEPARGASASAAGYVAPRTPTEEVLAGVCAEVLGVERIGMEDNFFDLGCHSLMATQIVARAREVFDVELPVASLFEAPTVEGLADRVDAASREKDVLAPPPLVPAPRDGYLPLSFAQERLWFLHQLDPDILAYNVPRALRILGDLKVHLLEQTFTEIIRRHEILRTAFPTVDGRPVQVIQDPWRLEIPVVDLSALPEAERRALVRPLIVGEGRQPFDLDTGPFLRLRLLRLAPEEHIFIIHEHHFVHDGWTQGVLLREFLTLYEPFSHGEPSPLPELPIQYADFAWWQRNWIQGEVLETLLKYWTERLAGAPPVLALPTDHPRPQVLTSAGGLEILTVPPALAEKLRVLSRREWGTLFMTLLTGFNALLCRYSRQEDISVGTGIANRRMRELEGMLGMLINTIVLRTDLSGNPTFKELFARVRETCLEAYAYQDIPFEKLVESLHPERSLGHTPIFQIMFSIHDTPMPPLELPGLHMSVVNAHNRSAKFDFGITVVPEHIGTGRGGGEMTIHFQFKAQLFEQATVRRFVTHYRNLLSAAVEDTGLRLWDLPLLTESEHAQIRQWNDTAREYPRDRCLHELFAEQAGRTPDALAVVYQGRSLTFREADRQANRLARLLQRWGVGPDSVVGLFLERSPEMLVGILGILKAGGAWLPLDPGHPRERSALILADAGAIAVVTQESLRGSLPLEIRAVCLDSGRAELERERDDAPASGAVPENLAYVIYTSGSTGNPKGVMIQHRSAANLVTALDQAIYSHHPGRLRVSVNAPLAFDGSVKQVLQVLRGHELHIVPSEARPDGEAMLAFLESGGVEVLDCIPSQLKLLLEAGFAERAPSTRVLLIGGEAIEPPLWERLAQMSGRSFYNVYGPTECTVDAAIGRVAPGQRPTIGQAVANAQVYVADSALRQAPVGVPGELVVSGAGVSRGYLNRPELTAERFVPDPFGTEPGGRLYRTGDLARFRADGNLEFLGRIDHQVKVLGFRVELGEIEALIASHEAVREALAVFSRDGEGDGRILAYVIPREGQTVDGSALRAHLRSRLPGPMIPSAFVVLAEFPRTTSGKVDRRALPAPEIEHRDLDEIVPLSTSTEMRLAEIWSEVLGLSRIGRNDSFFDLGGHSLLATQVISRARRTFGIDVPLRSLFETPRLRDLAVLVEGLEVEAASAGSLDELLSEMDQLSDEDVAALLGSTDPGQALEPDLPQ